MTRLRNTAVFAAVSLMCAVHVFAAQPSQNVNVVNTPTVNVGNNTVVVLDQTISQAGLVAQIPPFDVSAYKQIRVVVKTYEESGVTVSQRILLPGGQDSASFDDDVALAPNMTKMKIYDIPGQSIYFQLSFGTPNGHARVVVYGRAN